VIQAIHIVASDTVLVLIGVVVGLMIATKEEPK
jgi:hypothetical protein